MQKNKNTEKKIWKKLNHFQKTRNDVFLTKIESPTINGIPDVHAIFKGYCFWLELKANEVKNCNISKYQLVWHLKYKKAGGNCFILNQPLVSRAPQILEVVEPGIVVPVPVPVEPNPLAYIVSYLGSRPGSRGTGKVES